MGAFFRLTVLQEPRLKVPFYFPLMKMKPPPRKTAQTLPTQIKTTLERKITTSRDQEV
jgi:hypothetical protein